MVIIELFKEGLIQLAINISCKNCWFYCWVSTAMFHFQDYLKCYENLIILRRFYQLLHSLLWDVKMDCFPIYFVSYVSDVEISVLTL